VSPASSGSKADALSRGKAGRGSARPLPLPEGAGGAEKRSPAVSTPGTNQRGMRKVSVEMKPAEHDRFKVWVITTFGGGAAGAQVLRALLAEAYEDPALIERVRQRLAHVSG